MASYIFHWLRQVEYAVDEYGQKLDLRVVGDLEGELADVLLALLLSPLADELGSQLLSLVDARVKPADVGLNHVTAGARRCPGGEVLRGRP